MDVGQDAVADAADRDDAGPGDRQEPVQQQTGEGEVAQVVGAELQLEAVLGVALRRVHHAGVVDQQVDAVVVGAQLLGGLAGGLQRCQVEFLQRDVGIRGAPLNQQCGILAFVEVAHREDDVRALFGQRGCGLEAEAGVGAGDDGDATGLVRNVGGCPLGHG